jgi:hypothetical protein
VYAAGFSLGGWVVNLHRAFYGPREPATVDRYIPICSGARISPVFVDSVYQKLVDEDARSQPEVMSEYLDFEEEFRANKANDYRPLLFRHDALVELTVRRSAYDGMDLQILDKGHFAGQHATDAMRDHIAQAIDDWKA